MGADLEAVGKVPLYFELAYYAAIEFGLTHGIRCIDLGATAYRAKLSRGCRLELAMSYVLARDDHVNDRISMFAAAIDLPALEATIRQK